MRQRTKRTWTKWRRLIREQERSGQSVSEFCRERKLHASYFFAWRKRLRESATARFLEVQVAEPRPHTAGDSRVEARPARSNRIPNQIVTGIVQSFNRGN